VSQPFGAIFPPQQHKKTGSFVVARSLSVRSVKLRGEGEDGRIILGRARGRNGSLLSDIPFTSRNICLEAVEMYLAECTVLSIISLYLYFYVVLDKCIVY
jgi:hypothetical protein